MNKGIILAVMATCIILLNVQTVYADHGIPENYRTITVQGYASQDISPNIVKITVGVETFGDTVTQSIRENSEKIEKITESLTSVGITEYEIKTSYFIIQPEYDILFRDRDNHIGTVIGYTVEQYIIITTKNEQWIGDILDAVLSSGMSVVKNVSYDVTDSGIIYFSRLYYIF